MNCAKEARKLANYITNLPTDSSVTPIANGFSYHHAGALFTDIVLQAGLNYETVVKPRVQRVLLHYGDYYTVSRFISLLGREKLSEVIKWTDTVKLDRFERLLDFCLSNQIDTCADIKSYLMFKDHCEAFLSLKGFGPKTLDYLLKLLNVDTVAVDRHIYSFVRMADIDIKGYHDTKRVVEFAADFLNMSRRSVDHMIWIYMSQRKYEGYNSQLQLGLNYPDQ